MAKPLVLIEIIEFKKWKPLSRTHRFDELWAHLGEEASTKLMEAFTQFILNYYQNLILSTIKSQNFPGKKYPALSAEYALFKKRNHLQSGFWREYGDLQENLSHWKAEDGHYQIGFKPALTHSVTGASQVMVANVLERGSTKAHVPARPLFAPLAAAISKDITRFFEKFLKAKYPELSQYV